MFAGDHPEHRALQVEPTVVVVAGRCRRARPAADRCSGTGGTAGRSSRRPGRGVRSAASGRCRSRPRRDLADASSSRVTRRWPGISPYTVLPSSVSPTATMSAAARAGSSRVRYPAASPRSRPRQRDVQSWYQLPRAVITSNSELDFGVAEQERGRGETLREGGHARRAAAPDLPAGATALEVRHQPLVVDRAPGTQPFQQPAQEGQVTGVVGRCAEDGGRPCEVDVPADRGGPRPDRRGRPRRRRCGSAPGCGPGGNAARSPSRWRRRAVR